MCVFGGQTDRLRDMTDDVADAALFEDGYPLPARPFIVLWYTNSASLARFIIM
jgi:hypothetical protein